MNQIMVELKISSWWTTTPQVMPPIVEIETVGRNPCERMCKKNVNNGITVKC